MSGEAPAGLAQFSITRLCMLTTVILPIIASIADCKYWFLVYDDPFITEYKQYYRYVMFQIAAINETDVALITLIWYNLRHLERLFGSRKYASIIVLSWFYTTATIVLMNKLFNLNPFFRWNRLTSGSLPTVLSLFHFYKEYTPQIYEFDVRLTKPFGLRSKQLKWTFNDQFMINTLVMILLVNQGMSGLATGFLSWLCGVFIDKGLLPGSEVFRVPSFISRPGHNQGQTLVTGTESDAADVSESGAQGSVTGGDEEPSDEPARPLGVQFLDTFRM